jgi:hypothetical protein
MGQLVVPLLFGLWDMHMEECRRERERLMFQGQLNAKQARQLEAGLYSC